MKKKILSLCLVAVLLAIAIVGGTMAYFTDTDEVENVFTVGNVKINIIEETDPNQMDTDGNLILTQPGLKNEVKKFVYIANTGKNPAYVRVIFSIPAELDPVLNLRLANAAVSQDNSGDKPWYFASTECGVNPETGMYDYVFYLKKALQPGVTTDRLLSYVDLGSKFDWVNDGAGWTDGTNVYMGTPDFKVIVYAEAIQANGFDSYTEAFAAFDAQTTTSTLVEVSTTAELRNAIENSTNSAINISLADGEYVFEKISVGTGKTVTIFGSKDAVIKGQFNVTGTLNLSGITVNGPAAAVTGEVSQYSLSAIALMNTGDVVCNNVTFNQNLESSTAITAWWSTGDGANITVSNCTFNSNGNRPIRSDACVTVENCVFNDPYRYAVQMTSKSSTMDADALAYVNFNNNTIVAGTSTTNPVYGVQLEGDYGCSNLTINGTGNTIKVGTTGKTSAMYYCECGSNIDHDTITWNTEVAAVHAN